PELATALYAGFAVLGVAFFQFGVGIAAERATPWERYVRTLPLAARTRFAGRILSALAFGAASAAAVVGVALLTVSPELSVSGWIKLATALLAGSIPFALLGIALGYLASPRSALPIANVVYLALSYAGGLWTGPEQLPNALERVSRFLPTRAFADLLAGAALDLDVHERDWIVLVLYTVAAGLLAAWAYRRDEGERFS
ncbi:MAG: ABC transporter permease, partial [Actinobacteria bacterium]|nr:ABC transporter permease [Actinomycetota bacterium]